MSKGGPSHANNSLITLAAGLYPFNFIATLTMEKVLLFSEVEFHPPPFNEIFPDLGLPRSGVSRKHFHLNSFSFLRGERDNFRSVKGKAL